MEEGEDRAFEDFCRSVYPKAVRTAYLMTGDRQEAMDLAQDALVRTLERWRIVRGMDRPDAWVHTVVVNAARSWARKTCSDNQCSSEGNGWDAPVRSQARN